VEHLALEFKVTEEEQDVSLICELRAEAGEAWFALDTLRLWRFPQK
jgi:hypothetical protein